ncbi:MAG TPA: endonuclease/exonuclease/phosphatase family protein [Elainellaceae cyanobacterium]
MVHFRLDRQLIGAILFLVGTLSLTACTSTSTVSFDGGLTVASFNVESGGANPRVIADRHVAPVNGVDIWGFSEVQNSSWLDVLETGTEIDEGSDFKSILGTTGGGDRLAIVYNSRLLQPVNYEEIEALSFQGRVRAALVAHFRLRATGEEFLFMVNHLYRSEEESRHQQAQYLHQWVSTQTLPIVAVGDYNFDFDVAEGSQGKRDQGFDILTQGGAFVWIQPNPLIATICSDRYNSILDFIFVANGAIDWAVESSEILFTDSVSSYCPDDDTTSDHRPIVATFQLP